MAGRNGPQKKNSGTPRKQQPKGTQPKSLPVGRGRSPQQKPNDLPPTKPKPGPQPGPGKSVRVRTPSQPPASPLSKPQAVQMVELGVDDNLPFSTPYIEARKETQSKAEQLYELVNAWDEECGPTIPQLITMRRMDGQARALYRLITLPMRAALNGASFIAADGGDAEAKFIDQVFRLPSSQGGMTVTFERFMAHLLTAVFDGFSAFEQVYWVPTRGPLAGKVTLKKLAYRPSETISFVTDENGGFGGFRQRAFINGRYVDTYIPRDRAFYWAAQEEERKYYGVSFFQSAYYHYDKKMKLYFTAHLAAQRAAVGTRVGNVPMNATQADRAAFMQSMSNLAFAQYIVAPEGFEVDVLREGGSFDFLNFVNHHNSQMSKSILATFFDEDKGGGSADSKMINFGGSDNDMFILMLQSIMADIATSINQYIIPRLIDYNFGSGKYPQFTWGKLTEEQKAAVRDIFNTLSTAGQSTTVTPEFTRELEKNMAEQLGLQIDYKKVEKREQQQAAASTDQFAQAQTAANAGSALGPQAPADPNAPDPQVQQFEQAAMALSAEDTTDDDFAFWLSSSGPCSLAKTPQKDNWVDHAGHLPNYICHIAKAVMRSGHDVSSAIAIAVDTVKKWAAGADGVTAQTRAKAAAAVAEWEKLKGAAHAGHLVKAAAFDGTDTIVYVDDAEPPVLEDAELTDDEMDLLEEELAKLALSGRHVATPAGQLKYKQPVGSPIVADGPEAGGAPTTIERLISLYRQYRGFKGAGADDKAQDALAQLREAMKGFPKTKKNLASLSKLHHLLES